MIFGPASPEDYPAIQTLLSDADMPGWINLSYQADLSAGAAHPDAVQLTAVGRDDDQVVATANCTTYPTPQGPITWIGGLRVAPSHRGNAGVMRNGLEAIRAHLLGDPPDWQMAAVLEGNLPAKALLTRKRDGFPFFQPVIEYTTFAMRPRAFEVPGIRPAGPEDARPIAAYLAAQRRPLSPSIADFEEFGEWRDLSLGDFLVATKGDKITGVAALWDQRASRRYVVSGYSAGLRLMRPFWNLAAPMTGKPTLPPIGHPIEAVFLSFLSSDSRAIGLDLVRAALTRADSAGLGVVNLGLATDDPLHDAVAGTFRHQPYRSTFYGVTWPEGRNLPPRAFFERSKVELGLL